MEPDDLGPVLDTEIGRLPERLHRAVVLCYLKSHTAEDAAAILGCPRGTVLSRLASARKVLRRQLERRGVVPAALIGASACAAVPADLTAAAVTLSGGASTPLQVQYLSDGVIRAMFWNKCRIPLALLILAGACLMSVGIIWADRPGPNPVNPPPNEKPVPTADAIRPLLQHRRDNLREMLNLNKTLLEHNVPAGSYALECAITLSELLEVELELSVAPKGRGEALEKTLETAREWENLVEKIKKQVGDRVTARDHLRVRDVRLKIEIALLREKMKQAGK